MSSYQATDVATSPPVVAVTSLHPDHLPWHRGDPETYYADKLSLCSQPGADLTVANGTARCCGATGHCSGPGSSGSPPPTGRTPCRRGPRPSACSDGTTPATPASPGPRWRRWASGGGRRRRLAAAAAGFAPLESRLCPVATVGGVLCVDDGLSTNVLPTLAAVDAFPVAGWRSSSAARTGASTTPRWPRAWRSRAAPTAAVVMASEAAPRLRAAWRAGRR